MANDPQTFRDNTSLEHNECDARKQRSMTVGFSGHTELTWKALSFHLVVSNHVC